MKSPRAKQSLYLKGLIAAGLLMLFQNCGGFASNLDYNSSKFNLLSSGNIFAAANQIIVIGDACYEVTPSGGQTEVPCPTPTPTPAPTPPPENPEPTATPSPNPTSTPVVEEPPTTIDVPTFCATGFSQVAGYNLRTAGNNLKVAILQDKPFQDFSEGVGITNPNYTSADVNPLTNVTPVCEWTDPDMFNNLMNRKLVLSNIKSHCPNLQPGTYTLSVVRQSQTTNYHRGVLLTEYNAVVGTPYNVATPLWSDQSRVLYRPQITIAASASGGPRIASIQSALGDNRVIPMVLLDTYGQPGCQYSVSPLVVQMKKASPLRLTSQKDGVMFDILGLMSSPVAHTKQLISWFSRDNESDNYFIVLPNAKGEVNGIEEMFGDSTSGPDKAFAKNGYEALRKWDGRLASGKFNLRTRDGFINEQDEVFSKLRFWKDSNFDGIAQPSELFTLDELNVEFIDLSADANFMEKDQYGNRITLKSAVQTKDGVLHVMYDLWFALSN